MQTAPDQPGPYRQFIAKLVLAIGLFTLAALLWQIREILLLAFAGLLVAVVLHALANRLRRHGRLHPHLALAVASLALFGAVGGMLWLFGTELGTQLAQLGARMPHAVQSLEAWLVSAGYDGKLSDEMGKAMPDGPTLFALLRSLVGGVGGAVSGLLVAILTGIYMASQPQLYMAGVVKLFPRSQAPRVHDALEKTGHALRHWIGGQMVSMLFTSIAIGTGLLLIGVPTPLALAAIAGVMGFVPMIGPLIGAAAGLLVALTVDMHTLWMTALLYLVVQQIAGSVIEPLIMQHTVKLPPALTILSLLAIGTVLGVTGVLLGGPIVVSVYTLVRELYVKGTLGYRLGDEEA